MPEIKTFEYKKLNDSQALQLDVYFPPLPPTDVVVEIPIIVYFHAGALIAGNRSSILPTWFIDRVLPLGYAFISADYRLLMPHSGHAIVEDVKDTFEFVVGTEFKGDDYTFRLQKDRIAATGSSAGGHCAYLAAIHATVKPKVILSIYGMGGDYLNEYYLSVKKGELTFLGQKVPYLDPTPFSHLLYPFPKDMKTVIDVPLGIDGATISDDHRIMVYQVLHQQGTFVDYLTGLHKPSISQRLRELLTKENTTVEDFKNILPKDTHELFPQLCIDVNWPPTIMIHGASDDVVPTAESRHLRGIMKRENVEVELIEVENQHHAFDCFPGAEELHNDKFEAVVDFVRRHL